MTWNLKGSGGPPIDRVAQVVRDHAPDVLVVQEIRRHQARRLAATLGWSRSWHRKHHPYGPLAFWTTEGMALFTPHRLTATTALSLTPSISTWTYRHRVLVHGLVSRDDATAYRVFDVHLASDADGVSDRRDQAELVASAIAASGPAPVIVAGDFNDAAQVEVVSILTAGGRIDAWPSAAHRPDGDGFTNPAHAPHQRLDHVLVPADASVLSVDVPAGDESWGEISDHLPVVATFEMLWADGDFQISSQ